MSGLGPFVVRCFYSVRGEPVEPPLGVGHVSTGPELDSCASFDGLKTNGGTKIFRDDKLIADSFRLTPGPLDGGTWTGAW